jgi:hypothetical protein
MLGVYEAWTHAQGGVNLAANHMWPSIFQPPYVCLLFKAVLFSLSLLSTLVPLLTLSASFSFSPTRSFIAYRCKVQRLARAGDP